MINIPETALCFDTKPFWWLSFCLGLSLSTPWPPPTHSFMTHLNVSTSEKMSPISQADKITSCLYLKSSLLIILL